MVDPDAGTGDEGLTMGSVMALRGRGMSGLPSGNFGSSAIVVTSQANK